MDSIRNDVVKLITALLSPCPPSVDDQDHAWNRCPRCLLVGQIETHDPFAMALLGAARRLILGNKKEWSQPLCHGCYATVNPGRAPIMLVSDNKTLFNCCICNTPIQEKDVVWYRIDPDTVPYPLMEEKAKE